MNEVLPLHKINIIIHVIAGSIALLLGIVIIIAKKGKKFHIKTGRLFLVSLTLVIITGLIGVFVFEQNSFLIVITLLSGYQGFSGYRILKKKSNIPFMLDIIAALLTLSSALYFIYYFKSIGMMWSPIIIYSTVGFLILLITYDFFRYFIPKKRYKKFWLSEHIYKMMGAFTGLLAAFIGTVFPQYHPYSQFLPSLFGTSLAIGFVIYFYRKKEQSRKKQN